MCAHMIARKYAHMYIHTDIHTCIYTYIHIYAHTFVHTYKYTHTYIHTYTHTYVRITTSRHACVLARTRVRMFGRPGTTHTLNPVCVYVRAYVLMPLLPPLPPPPPLLLLLRLCAREAWRGAQAQPVRTCVRTYVRMDVPRCCSTICV